MHYTKLTLCLLLVVLSGHHSAYSQYIFRHLDIADGLSDNQIRSLTMAPDGRLAIRTASILNLYDGFSFRGFYPDKWNEYLWSYAKLPREYYDSRGRIWMKASGSLLLLDLRANQFIYDIDSVLLSLGVRGRLKDLFIDDAKNYWFVTEDNTLSRYDISRQELKIITPGAAQFAQNFGVPRALAQHGSLCWMVYSSGLIRCWDAACGEFTLQDARFLNIISDITDRLYIHPADNGDLWLMYNFAVYYYRSAGKTWTKVAAIAGASNFFTCMDVDREGDAWVGTSRSGLRRIRRQTFAVEAIPELMVKGGGVSNNDIHAVLVDGNNGLWVGSLFQGLYYYHASMQKFRLVQTVKDKTATTNEVVRCFLEDKDGTVLVGTANGLFRYFPDSQKTEKVFGDLINELCLTLYRDRKGRIWVGTFLSGFFCIDGSTITRYNLTRKNMSLYPNQNISRAIYEDPSGRYWVSVKNRGVGELDPQTGRIAMLSRRFPKIAPYKISYNFYPVSDHRFAVLDEAGIYYYDTQADSVWIPEVDAPGNPKFRDRDTKYYCMKTDRRALEWFGTELGIRVWDEKSQTLYVIDKESGMPNNSISAIEEDEEGVMWVSSVAGITRINVGQADGGYTFELMSFTCSDGLQSGKFYDRSSLKASDGTLYFGGVHGFNTFHPKNMTYNRSKNKPLFTSLKLFNQPIGEDGTYRGRTILQKPLSSADKICLRHNENFISIEFAGLNFVDPSQTGFRYRLEGYDKSWNEIDANGAGAVTYTGLPPGKYRLTVYTANNDKLYGDEPAYLNIEVDPPLWATFYAYTLYALLGLTAIYFMVKVMKKRKAKKQAEREALEREKQKEALDQMKFRFFTNISHEFRTPLTLIMTPLSRLMQEVKTESVRQKLSSIYRNAENMLGLINQLLDFRKLEMGGERLRLLPDDMVSFVQYAHAAFKDVAESKAIAFTLESECRYLPMHFDKGMLHKIINNLYSNALKFTPSGGRVSTAIRLVQEDGRAFARIDVADTGCGVTEGELHSIFERFYQSENSSSCQTGSGIGLHLAKEYAELHGGRIAVSSAPGQGSVFSVLIPTGLPEKPPCEAQAPTGRAEEAKEAKEAKEEEADFRPDHLKTLLIVEDNMEFLDFLAAQLSDKFRVLKAANGKQGEEIANKSYPDLIISDLMMPGMSGVELCRRLKSNIHTSHIPLMLLTARLSDEAKIECYKAGADSYIAKPFNFDVLLTRINALIAQQEKRKNLFRKTIEVTPSSVTSTSLDEELVKKALLCVEKNIGNPHYSVDSLGADVALSRSQLYRKLHSILGVSPHEFILSIRLKRAAQLLKDTRYNISEISDMVGFNTIRYFNRYFKAEFGVTPTLYRAQLIANDEQKES
jgi:signal transduction histidine kinase/DNA-binding response OmpR family regulator/ligand-binding sensor domain-containing protein